MFKVLISNSFFDDFVNQVFDTRDDARDALYKKYGTYFLPHKEGSFNSNGFSFRLNIEGDRHLVLSIVEIIEDELHILKGIREETTYDGQSYFVDQNGNCNYVHYHKNRKKALEALLSLEDCSSCTNCEDCISCYSCHECTNCEGISRKMNLHNTDLLREYPDLVYHSTPKISNIHQTVYSACSVENNLDMNEWHSADCKTIHCRGGWVIHLAGKKGYELVKKIQIKYPNENSSELAASLIYARSGYFINAKRFYDDNSESLEHMRKLAEEEKNAS